MRLTLLILVLSIFFLPNVRAQETTFGDTLTSFNAGILTPTPDRNLRGIEYADGFLWVTGSDPDDSWQHKLYKFSGDGQTLVDYFEYGLEFAGWSDLAYDGEFLYVTDIDTIRQLDMETGQKTGVKIKSPMYYNNGLAYDAETDHFWISGDGNNIYEVDREGEIINAVSFIPDLPAAGLAWDSWTEGGPYLWVWSMKYTPSDVRPKAFQLNPATGLLTGLEFEGELMHPNAPYGADYAAGATISDEFIDGKVAFVTIHASSYLQNNDQLDWVVVYDLDPESIGIPGPQIAIDPGFIENDLLPGDSMEIPLIIDNLSDEYLLNWVAKLEYPGPDNSAEPGDVLSDFNASVLSSDTNTRMNGVAFLNDHIYISTSLNFNKQFFLYKIKKDGSEIVSVDTLYSGFNGWTAISSDDKYIYGVQQYMVQVYDPETNTLVETYGRPGFTPDALAYDPQKELFYGGNGVGAIMEFNKEGDETNFYVTPYDIEGLAWDHWSPGGPFLWVYYTADATTGQINAIRLDPATGGETGLEFEGINLSGDPTDPDRARDIIITADWQENKLAMIGLHDSNEEPGDGQDKIVIYDLAVTPAPGWIDLRAPSFGTTEMESSDTLFVKLKAIMEDTLMIAQVVISTNDVSNPKVIVPVNFTMLPALTTNLWQNRDEPSGDFQNAFPNPTMGTIQLDFEKNSQSRQLQVFDPLGKLLFKQTIAKDMTSFQLDMSEWKNGLYNIILTSQQSTNSVKVIKR